MKPDWDDFIGRLTKYGTGAHRFLPPCSEKRIAEAERDLGNLPDELKDMLRRFNGAELFIRHGPLITLFGISPIPPPGPFEWAEDWWIDRFTPTWRRVFNRDAEWAIAMTNYGGLSVLGGDGEVREWDTGQRDWGPADSELAAWIDRVLREGDDFWQETG